MVAVDNYFGVAFLLAVAGPLLGCALVFMLAAKEQVYVFAGVNGVVHFVA